MNFDMAPRANECCEAADVCLVVEGCYPYISGGVSNWINWLIKSQEHLTFSVVAIVAGAGQRQVRYERPANLVTFQELNVSDPATLAKGVPKATVDQLECASKLAEATSQLIAGGGAREFAEVLGCLRASKMALTLPTLLNSPVAWNMVQGTYRTLAPNASFLQFFGPGGRLLVVCLRWQAFSCRRLEPIMLSQRAMRDCSQLERGLKQGVLRFLRSTVSILVSAASRS